MVQSTAGNVKIKIGYVVMRCLAIVSLQENPIFHGVSIILSMSIINGVSARSFGGKLARCDFTCGARSSMLLAFLA